MQHEEDFLITNSFCESDFETLKNFKLLKEGKTHKSLLSRKPGHQDENAYLYNIAKHMNNNNKKLFRKKDDADLHLTVLWLSLVEESSVNFIFENGIKNFKKLDYEELHNVSALSIDPMNLQVITKSLYNKYGIILVFVKSFKGMKLDGCTFKLPSGNPVIGLSLRYSRYDYFWFTLMHELSHISLHYDLLDSPIIDNLENDSESDVEIEANRAAADSLIPREAVRHLSRTIEEPQELIKICSKYRINPIIAAGSVRKKYNNYVFFSDLVHSINVRKEFNLDD